jgi:hypothetical protein
MRSAALALSPRRMLDLLINQDHSSSLRFLVRTRADRLLAVISKEDAPDMSLPTTTLVLQRTDVDNHKLDKILSSKFPTEFR